jgi:hypothetical protein
MTLGTALERPERLESSYAPHDSVGLLSLVFLLGTGYCASRTCDRPAPEDEHCPTAPFGGANSRWVPESDTNTSEITRR